MHRISLLVICLVSGLSMLGCADTKALTPTAALAGVDHKVRRVEEGMNAAATAAEAAYSKAEEARRAAEEAGSLAAEALNRPAVQKIVAPARGTIKKVNEALRTASAAWKKGDELAASVTGDIRRHQAALTSLRTQLEQAKSDMVAMRAATRALRAGASREKIDAALARVEGAKASATTRGGVSGGLVFLLLAALGWALRRVRRKLS